MLSLKNTGRKYPVMIRLKKYSVYFSFILTALLLMNAFVFLNFTTPHKPIIKPGILKINFKNTVSGRPMVLNDSVYTNVFGETFSVSKFKYYISSPGLKNLTTQQKEKNGCHLIDATVPASQKFEFTIAAGKYSSLFFLAGVDSVHNSSGAQTGALDPMNDMFWTWNSGYVMAKLEGISSASSSINQRIEYHIGGYKGKDNVLQKINLIATTPIVITPGKITEVIIETDISKWWQVSNPVSIKENPVCSTPGVLAKKIADNYRNMFMIQSISNN